MDGYLCYLVLMVALFWAENAAEGAANQLECALGPYPSGLLTQLRVPDEFDADEAVDHVPDAP